MIQFSDNQGVTWKTLADFGLILQPGHEHPFIPDIENINAKIGGADGLYDFGGRNSVRPFRFPLCFPYETTVYAMQQRGRQLAAFLSDAAGRPRTVWLRYEYELDKFYSVRYVGSVVPKRSFETASFDLLLVAYDPFAYQIDLSTEITWESMIDMNNDVLTFDDDEFSFLVSAPELVTVKNFGDLEEWPVIEVDGSFTTLTISCGDRTLVYGEEMASGTLIIDCKKMSAKLGATNKNNKVTGQWIKLQPGSNAVTIGGTGLNCTVSFPFRAKYL